MNRQVLSALLKCIGVLSCGALLPGANAATRTITESTLIEAADSSYDGEDLVVTGCVLTVNGDHGFNSLQLASGATVAIAGGATLNVAADLTVAGNSTVVCQGKNTVDRVDDEC